MNVGVSMSYITQKTIFVILVGTGLLFSSSAGAYDYSLLPPMDGQVSDFAERRAGKEVNASIQIGVTNDGIYRITYSNLTNAGVAATNLIGASMRLFCRTQEIAILVSNTNQWSAADYLLFPGQGFDGYYSMTNVYWLGFGTGGKRMASRSAAPIGGASSVTSYRKTALHHVDAYFKNGYRPTDVTLDHWVDLYLTNSIPQDVLLATDQVVSNTSAQFDAVMYGVSSLDTADPDHCTMVSVSNAVIGRFLYDGQTTAMISTSFPSALLQATNSFRIQQIPTNGAPADVAYLERCSVSYVGSLVAIGSALEFAGAVGTNNYLVRGFAVSNSPYVFDTTDPANAVMLTGGIATNVGAGGYALAFGEATVSTSRYSVCQDAVIKAVSSIQRTSFRDLVSTNRQADYVVICPYAFRQQVYRLLALRHAQGLSVAVAPLPDIYNEFGYGIADAVVLKNFIGYMYHHWKSPPRYVLLAGTGTYDPRHNVYTEPDVIPVYQGPCYDYIPEYNLWTALDNWYATVKKTSTNDYSPNVFLGRIPVSTGAQLKNTVDKIVAFEGVPTNDLLRSYAELVADKTDTGNSLDFGAASEVLRTNDLVGMIVEPLYKTGSSDLSGPVLSAINDGRFLVNYFGHGMTYYWSGTPSLLTVALVTNSLSNTDYPIVSMLTCLNGAFQDPSLCLAEALLQGTHGASACVAASGLTSLGAGTSVAHGFYQAVRGTKKKRIGDAMEAAYNNLFLMNGNTREALFFELFGDPAMVVNP